jgi:hypothetical protein
VRESIEVKLKTPVLDSDGRVVLDVLKIVKPRAGDLRKAYVAAKGDSSLVGVLLVGICAGVAQPIIDSMELDDFEAAGNALAKLTQGDDAGEA